MIRPTIGTTAVVLITCGLSTRFLALNVLHSVVLVTLLMIGAGVGPEGIAMAHVGTTILLMLPKLHYSFVGTPATVAGFFSAIRPALRRGHRDGADDGRLQAMGVPGSTDSCVVCRRPAGSARIRVDASVPDWKQGGADIVVDGRPESDGRTWKSDGQVPS